MFQNPNKAGQDQSMCLKSLISDLMCDIIDIVTSKLGAEIPIYLPVLLFQNGYDNLNSLAQLDATKFEEIENSVRDGEIEDFIPKNADRQIFYGKYHASQKKFKILQWHKDLLLKVASICQSELIDNKKIGKTQLKLNSSFKKIEGKVVNIAPKSFSNQNEIEFDKFVDDLKKRLQKTAIENAERVLKNFNTQLTEQQKQQLDSWDVKIEGSDVESYDFCSDVPCIFCKSKVKVGFDRSRWKMGNMVKHLTAHLSKSLPISDKKRKSAPKDDGTRLKNKRVRSSIPESILNFPTFKSQNEVKRGLKNSGGICGNNAEIPTSSRSSQGAKTGETSRTTRSATQEKLIQDTQVKIKVEPVDYEVKNQNK